MNQRLAKALSAAALGIAATGLILPQAAADSVAHLAPGVDCNKWQCTNNTNDEYRITFDAICIYPGSDEPRQVDSDDEDWVLAHKQEIISPNCSAAFDHEKKPKQGIPVDVYYKSATIDNRPPLFPTGSAG